MAPDFELPYTPGEPIPTTEGIEGDDWALWSEATVPVHVRVLNTVPPSDARLLTPENTRAWEQTQQMTAVPDVALACPSNTQPSLTLDMIMLVSRRNHRVSPRPEPWLELYALLPLENGLRGNGPPPPPPSGAAWAATPSVTKQMCWREHMEWAEEHGMLETVMAFIQRIPEQDWLHVGED